ncbi:MAG: hypothetical protein ONB44_01365 [candidate division KSB1 bacterium]|nr:hypothetical protein [candidate division KSB1 bacterium]MDZ7300768.1 hypothetical protein [candidate division KSB1 bacterium]MDZ7309962.1 hypothetical protein [candidate division KSB1 bacterium]
MSKRIQLVIFTLVGLAPFGFAAPAVKIINLTGEVKIRRGMEENWHRAVAGMRLEEIDTILTGEASAVVLETAEGSTFRLGSYSILDIADLRKITERELFLYLMSQKVNRIEPRLEKTRLRIGNVSVIHGESKAGSSHRAAESPYGRLPERQNWVQETNGAKALFEQDYYPNTIVKLHKILAKYPDVEDCGEIHFYLGKAFEALGKPGQAIDAYKVVLERVAMEGCENAEAGQRAGEAKSAMERLRR